MSGAKIFLILAVAILSGCHSAKQAASTPPVILTSTDSANVVYMETVIIDTTIIEVPLPMESAIRASTGSTSHLETSVAESDAWMNPDGTIGHSLANKPASIETQVLGLHKDITNRREVIKERQIPVPEPYPVEVERKFTNMEQIKLATYWYLAGALMLATIYIFKRPILLVLRKLISPAEYKS